VLSFGLIKIWIISGRFWEYLSFAREWRALAYGYLSRTKGSRADFYADIGDYIGLVISWNSDKNSTEGKLKRMFRFIVVIPLWYAIGTSFKRLSKSLRSIEQD
jgi:hypothetical protein